MAAEDVKRKLTAIFSADVVGYSRLMGEDEVATVQTLTSHKETMRKMIRLFRGRVVDSIGDNLMAEFTSVVDAVQCAVKVQQVISKKNEDLLDNRRMYFRIGINLGDVIEEGERLYGDGVNIASRVESLAEEGGISLSGTAYDQLGKKLPLGYEYLGEQSVKNIDKPVRVYRVLTEAEAAGKVIGEERPRPRKWPRSAIAAVVILLIIAGTFAIWNFYFRPPPIEPASMEKMAFELPDKPSIAVLPFVNMSEDPKQDYFSDGLTEEIITTLSKVSDLFVVAGQSTFSYKDKMVKVQQVAEELGVRYVLEGSVRKAEDRARITALLIDALTGHHLWAEGYDRELKDTLAVQGEITKEIITALQVQLTKGEQARVFARGTDNVEAWALGAKAWRFFAKPTKENNPKARQLLERGIKFDPDYALLWTHLGGTHILDARFGWTKSRTESFKRAVECVKKALTLDEESPIAHSMMANIYLLQRQHERGIAEGERAISLDPNYADGYARLTQVMLYSGRFEEALTFIKKAMRLCPTPRVWYPAVLGQAYYNLERYEEAIATWNQLLDRCRRGECPPNWAQVGLIVCYIGLGRAGEARAEAEELLRVDPTFSLERYSKQHFFKDPAHLERVLSALRKAGLPDKLPLPLPDKPSIAVLPFVNISDDPKQEYFSDGITEQIITALSKSPHLFVISRSSTFTYKGKSVKAQQVSRDLGVRYVLEGSVQRSGDRLRITAQLIDAIEDHHIWAERYDRELKDIFALQDEITVKITSALRVKLVTGGEVAAQSAGSGTKNLQAYLTHLEAYHYLARGTPEDYALARKLSEEAIALDPEYPTPYHILALTHLMEAILGTSKSPRNSIGKAFKLAQKAVAMDDSDAPSHHILGMVYRFKRELEKAIAEGERAVALDPNYARGYMWLANSLITAGRPREAIPLLKKSMRLSPLSQTHASMCLFRLGRAYRTMGQYEEALSALKKALNIRPNFFGIHLNLAATYIHLGREEEAHAAAAEVRRIVPKFSLERYAKRVAYKDPVVTKRYIDALREAGLK
jgi:adenylate cyclase